MVIALDGVEGVAMADAKQPDLILLDLVPPAMDSWQASQQLKSMPNTARVPIIALTAHALVGDREQAIAAGCDECESKPVDFGRLLAKIEALIRT